MCTLITNLLRVSHQLQLMSTRGTTKLRRATTAVALSFKVHGETINPNHPPIVLIHGLLQTKGVWTGMAKTIFNVTKRAVITLDLRNHGDSPFTKFHTYEDLAEDLRALLDKFGQSVTNQKVTILGHGMGGRVGMCFSLMQPDRVTDLVIADSSPTSVCPRCSELQLKILKAMSEITFMDGNKPITKLTSAKKLARGKLKPYVQDEFILKMLTSNIAVTNKGVYGFKYNVDVLIKDFALIEQFPSGLMGNKFFGPTLFIGGQLSENIPPDDLPRIREMFPRSMVKYIRGAGHYVFNDDTQRFLEYVISFFRSNHVGYTLN